MISLLLDHATSLRPNIPQDSMRFHVFPSAESTHFHQVPSISMKFQQCTEEGTQWGRGSVKELSGGSLDEVWAATGANGVHVGGGKI